MILLIGAQVVGTGASDIISELGLAIEAGMNAEDIVLTIHASNISEMTMEAAEKLSDTQSIQCNNLIIYKRFNIKSCSIYGFCFR